MISVLIAVFALLGSFVTYYLTRKQQLESEHRKLKQEYYRNFIKSLSDVAIDNFDHNAQKKLSESINSLIVIATPKVVYQLMKFHGFVCDKTTKISRNSSEWSKEHDNLLRHLILAIRKDIYGNETNVDSLLAEVRLVGSNGKK